MDKPNSGIPKLRKATRKKRAVSKSASPTVCAFLRPDEWTKPPNPAQQKFPLVYRSNTADLEPVGWAASHRQEICQQLLKYGAVLFRGFEIGDPQTFGRFAAAIAPDLLDYVERAAPRRHVADKVLTSTEYPADQWIPLHHEMSYAHQWPTKLFFYCHVPPQSGGYTPLTDERETIKKIPASIQETFLKKGIMYVRNYGLGVDMSWQEVFQTQDKSEVEAYLRDSRVDFEWYGEDQLRTRFRRQVTATHPLTGDRVWFNHAPLFHISNMPDFVRKALLEEFNPGELPRNAFYGDGSTIPDETAATIRQIYQDSAVLFPWRKGDVLLIDNFLTAHGRTPFSGPRRIYVSMAELHVNSLEGT